MATLVIIIAFWLILVGIYGAISLLKEESLGRRPLVKVRTPNRMPRFPRSLPKNDAPSLAEPREPRHPVMPAGTYVPSHDLGVVGSAARQPEGVGNLFSEVDMLRAQVEHLRSEIYAMSSSRPERFERPRTRRYSPGVYTYLPRILRRHVHEARRVRRPLGV